MSRWLARLKMYCCVTRYRMKRCGDKTVMVSTAAVRVLR